MSTEFLLQANVSINVLRFADQLPDDMVEYHRDVLQGLGIVGEVLANYLELSSGEWLDLIDQSYGEV